MANAILIKHAPAAILLLRAEANSVLTRDHQRLTLGQPIEPNCRTNLDGGELLFVFQRVNLQVAICSHRSGEGTLRGHLEAANFGVLAKQGRFLHTVVVHSNDTLSLADNTRALTTNGRHFSFRLHGKIALVRREVCGGIEAYLALVILQGNVLIAS